MRSEVNRARALFGERNRNHQRRRAQSNLASTTGVSDACWLYRIELIKAAIMPPEADNQVTYRARLF